ncbi:hypothetical protein [Kutzneria chonburiensis]|uniref:Nephrocystin 3-like N-terminal domain-containing protein n=1 Tax=Kutzneria chonburiensis TaxID=1483604 RepID=A0ABV6MKV8_9PSEU|nr:hypothetical protein [Kutzneria chonburiensis]
MADNSGIVSTGANAINIQYLAPSALVRTQYHRQVERIAPPALTDRAAELAELAAFCTSSTGYAWWRAKAWSGKSALMSWFVLHPPPGVRIVSFFITARLAAQNDRNAFVENVLEQLLALLGESMPAFLTESTREAHLLDHLSRAAAACSSRGEHFVLLVDGLDEDRGVDEHSIAALLPLSPPPGMHVLVAGRPNPPVPGDVPAHHPLRDPSIIRELTPSPRAQALRVEMEKDLKRLLLNPDSRDLLGLVTAAGGGLSAADLVSLTGQLLWEIDGQLQTIAGRSFAIRDPYYSTEAPSAYLLAHEELQLTALDMLGPVRLAGYRDRLHTWAHGYRDRQWPADTPEYLLRGYFRMLIATDNIPELLSCATDTHRQDRLLSLTGGDTAALAELRSAMETLAAKENPDLVALTRLAIHRDHLTERHADVPVELAAAWAALRNYDRAEAIADSMAAPDEQAAALAQVAKAMLAAGIRDRAMELLDRAERIARTATDYEERAEALSAVAVALVKAREPDRAEALVTDINPVEERDEAMSKVAIALAAVGAYDRAEALFGAITAPEYEVDALIALAPTLGDDAVERVRDAITAHMAWNPRHRMQPLAALITELVGGGATDKAHDLLRWARKLAAQATDAASRRFLAEALVAVGELDEAETTARTVGDPVERAAALVTVANGHRGRAAELLDLARRTLPAPPDDDDDVLVSIADGFARIGDTRAAAAAADGILDQRHSTKALARIAMTLLDGGHRDQAIAFVTRAEQRVHGESAGVRGRLEASARIAEALAMAGDHTHAAEVIGRVDTHGLSFTAAHELGVAVALGGDLERGLSIAVRQDRLIIDGLTTVAARLAEAGQLSSALDVLGRAAGYADNPGLPWNTVNGLVRMLVSVGAVDRAEQVARAMPRDDLRSELLATLAIAAAENDSGGRAVELVERIADSLDRPDVRTALAGVLALAGQFDRALEIVPRRRNRMARDAWPAMAWAFARSGHLDAAMQVVDSLREPDTRHRALAKVAHATALAGQVEAAVELSHMVDDPSALVDVVKAVAAAGDLERAEEVARTISDQRRRGEALLKLGLVAEALTLTDWRLAVPDVVKTAPDALAEIFGELDRVYGRSAEV